ncbi:hydroxymethylglutaryl-CoA lyase [Thioalkalivibrio sp. XN8]|uniref:hydroxymethylglutaryl-CoA lyase n=1 Tax=Thioalkalivibrio sp. XN8 TaxID=2712863 RepID=UPI0013ECA940|nr:hydroxymethylglutaryl-CoA lyase [Thioalkalivibrio sp. XN8]
MSLPTRVRIVEVGPRDGLQNEPATVPAAVKIEFIQRLAAAGLPAVEATSFVSPRWIPQLADAEEVYRGLERRPGVAYPVLVPNLQGLERAMAAGAEEIAVFTAASEAFNQKNINASISESLDRIRRLADPALERGLRIRGYISCVLGCPYEGPVREEKVVAVAAALFGLGCYEVSLGDTIGVGTPVAARRMLWAVAGECGMERLAVHFHDTRGQALANIFACLEAGVTTVDASVAGLGGCPYARGASGNVATEDLAYLLQGLGIETGVDLPRLVAAGRWICARLGREPRSRLALLPEYQDD